MKEEPTAKNCGRCWACGNRDGLRLVRYRLYGSATLYEQQIKALCSYCRATERGYWKHAE